MVKKLFKHEFLFYARVMAIVYGILLTVSVATKLLYVFESDTIAYQIVRGFTTLVYGVSVFATMGFSFVMGIVRFYRNLFTAEGYLSFTLPVTAGQHILVKVVTAVAVNAVSLIAMILSGLIVLSGYELTELWTDMQTVWQAMYPVIGNDAILFLVEICILAILAAFAGPMLYYCCIAIGQMAKKNRILAAVGVYFAYYVLTQIIASFFTIGLSILATSDAFIPLANWIGEHPLETIHIAFGNAIVLYAVFIVVEFFILRGIMNKKLNLE